MSVVNVAKESLPAWNAGNGTVGTTPQQLGPSWPVQKAVTIRANSANTAAITISPNPGSAANGFQIGAGEDISIPVDDVAAIYVVATSGTQGYSWCAV